MLPGEETVAFAPSASFDEVDGSLPITEKGVILLWGEFIVFWLIRKWSAGEPSGNWLIWVVSLG